MYQESNLRSCNRWLCNIIHSIPWSASSAIVGDFVVKFRNYIEKQLQSYDVNLVFDRYRDYSAKGVTRVSCRAQLSRVHQLTIVMPKPPPKVILTTCIPDNKHQLIDFIVNDLCSNAVFPETPNIRQLVVTGEDHVPVELISTVTIKREDLRTNHEEAAIIKSSLLRIRKTRVYLSYPMTQIWLYSCYIIMSSRSLLG